MIFLVLHRLSSVLLLLLAAALSVSAQGERVAEVVVGEPGLSLHRLLWQRILPATERVWRGGRLLRPGEDYFLQPELGYVRFDPPLDPGETAEVQYEIVAGHSTRRGVRMLPPIETDFFIAESARLGLVGQLRDDQAGYFGLRGSARFHRGWQWSGAYLLSEKNAGDMRSSFLRLGLDGALAGGSVRASFHAAGEQFLSAKSFGAKPGQQIAAAEWRSEGRRGRGFLSYKEERGETFAKSSAAAGFEVLFDPRLTLAGSRKEDTEAGVERTSDRISLSYTPYDRVGFGWEWLQDPSGPRNRLTFAATDPIVSLSASHTLFPSGGPGETSVTGRARLTRSFRVETSALTSEENTVADTRVWWEPLSRLGLAGSYYSASNAPFAEAVGLEAKWSPILPLEFYGMGRRRVSPERDSTVDTVMTRVTARPLRGLALRAEYAERPEDKLGMPQAVRKRLAGAEATLGSLHIGGTYAASAPTAYGPERRKVELESSMNLSPRTRLRLGYGEEGFFAGSLTGERYYSLGVYGASSHMSFRFEGRLRDRYESGLRSVEQRRYEATASLGYRF